jgi:hypothetical protein
MAELESSLSIAITSAEDDGGAFEKVALPFA